MASKVTLMPIPIDDIELDINNPRIAKYIEIYGEKIKAEQIALALNVGDPDSDDTSTTYRSLKASIRTNGGIINPIIVNKRPDGSLVVIEGNTRVAIYRELREEKAPGDWDEIIALVTENMTPTEIDSIRLQAHLVGPRAWDPYSKAKYLEYLRNSEHLTLNQIVDYCGGREREIMNYIQAYLDMENYYRPLLTSDDEFDPSRFSAFVELQKNVMKDSLLKSGFSESDYADWVMTHKIHPLLAVRKLPMILANPKSREVFLKHKGKGAIEAAEKMLDKPTPEAALREATLQELADEIVQRILSLPYSQFQALKSDSAGSGVQSILDARDQLEEFINNLELK
jgi:hypothetical protein